MKNLKKIIFLAIIGIIACSLPVAMAKRHRPIHPGDHVFDAKRYADSVKETAQMVINVQNSLKKLKNQGLINAGCNLEQFTKDYNTLAKKVNAMSGDSVINPQKNYENAETYKETMMSDVMQDNGAKDQRLLNEASIRKAEMMKVIAEISNRTHSRINAINKQLQVPYEGNLAELQVANGVAIMSAVNDIDSIRTDAAAFADSLQSQEEAIYHGKLEEQKKKAATFYGYDPYNPSASDAVLNTSNSHDLGFKQLGQH